MKKTKGCIAIVVGLCILCILTIYLSKADELPTTVDELHGNWSIMQLVGVSKVQQSSFTPETLIGKTIEIRENARIYPYTQVEVEECNLVTVERVRYETSNRIAEGVGIADDKILILQDYYLSADGVLREDGGGIIVVSKDIIICPMISGWFLCERIT